MFFSRFWLALQYASVQEQVRKVVVWAKHMETHIVLLFKWDETQQRVLAPIDGQPATARRKIDKDRETITAPIFVAFSRFKTSEMARLEQIFWPVLRLTGLTARHIWGGVRAACFLFSGHFVQSACRLAIFYVLVSDDASANCRLVAHMCNIFLSQMVFIMHILCQVHVAHTVMKPAVLSMGQVDMIFRWAHVNRIYSFRKMAADRVNSHISMRFVYLKNRAIDPALAATQRKLMLFIYGDPRTWTTYRSNLIEAVLAFFNGDWRTKSVVHICHGCCADKAAAIKTAQNLVFRLLHRRKIPIPKLSDWTHITASSQHILMGRLLHGLWNLAEVFDISGANMEGVRARAEGPTDADLHDDGWIAQHGARVARTILASAEDDRFFAILVFLAATKEVSHLKAWFLKRTSGVNPKYKVDQTQNTTYVLLTPWLSPLFLALVSVCAPMKIRAAHEHFCWIWHFFPEVPAGEWCRRFFDMLVPLAGRLYWFMVLPLAQWPLSMFQMVNEFIGHDYRAWWVNAFSTEDECCLDQCSRKARRTHAGAASPGKKHRSLYSLFRGLHDCSLCAEWSIVDIETTHGRLRWLSGLGTQRTGTWTSTFGAYQTYFMGVRYHLEAATAALAETQGRLTARVRELRDQVAVFRKQLHLPGHWWFKKDNGLSGAESDRLWGNMSEAERGKWKDAAASARSMAKSKWERARKELTAAEAECGISDTQSPRTPWGAGSSQHPLRAEVLAKDQLLEKCDVKGGGRPTVERRLNAQKIQEAVHGWSHGFDEATLPDSALPAKGGVTYDNANCQVTQFCRAKLHRECPGIAWASWLRGWLSFRNLLMSYSFKELQGALVLHRMQACRLSDGVSEDHWEWTHLLWVWAQNDPRFKALAVRFVLAPWEDRPLRGALPLPPYDLVFKFVDRAWGPQRLDWSVKIWDFLFAAEAMREFMVDSGTPGRPSSLPERSCVELDWRIHIRCGTIAIHVESDKAEHFWWRNGPVQNARKKPPKAESLKGELAAAKQAARKPVPPRGAKPAPKKARRKLSEADKLEEQLFGSVLGEADAPGAPAPAVDEVKVAGLPEDAGHGHAADADCDDAPDALRELWGDDHCGDSELDVELDGDFDDEDEDGPPGPPAPVPPAPPAPVSFDLDELGCIPRDAALTLLLPPAANGRISVVSPEDPSRIIGELQPQLHLDAMPYACYCKLHKKCSRMRAQGSHEPPSTDKATLVRWLVSGLQRDAKDEASKSWHMARHREVIAKGKGKGKK